MRGSNQEQSEWVYNFSVESRVPSEHPPDPSANNSFNRLSYPPLTPLHLISCARVASANKEFAEKRSFSTNS